MKNLKQYAKESALGYKEMGKYIGTGIKNKAKKLLSSKPIVVNNSASFDPKLKPFSGRNTPKKKLSKTPSNGWGVGY